MHACRSTLEHPSCKSALEFVKPCCRGSDGNPWPPVPKNVPRDSYTVHELTKSDVPTLDDLKLNRGQMFRKGRYPPFASETWKARSVVCARWERSTTEAALHEWLDHHKYGVRLHIATSAHGKC
jgi:hypothetical protein